MSTHSYPTASYNFNSSLRYRINSSNNVVWINVPKNSSTLINGYLKNLNWQEVSDVTPFNDVDSFLVVLRDPISRWVSGITEYMHRYHANFELDQATDLLKDIIVEKKFFDNHTVPQYAFLNQIPKEKCVYFRMDTNLTENFQDYLEKHCNISNNSLQYIGKTNSSNDSLKKAQLKEFFNSIVNVPKYREQIETFYEYDFLLFNSASFYQKEQLVIEH